GLEFVGETGPVTVAVGATESYVVEIVLEAVFALPAASDATPAARETWTDPCPVGLTVHEYVVPEPLNPLTVALLAVTSVEEKQEPDSLNVAVTVNEALVKDPTAEVSATVGLVWSIV